LPLSKNAAVLYERLAPGGMDVYSRRLNLAAEKVMQGKAIGEMKGRENGQ
jgi:hypothetical protein